MAAEPDRFGRLFDDAPSAILSRREIRRRYGVETTARMARWGPLALAILVVIILAGTGIAWLTDTLSGEATGQAFAATLALAALGLAVLQWVTAGMEKSLDSLYARIDLANRWRAGDLARPTEGGPTGFGTADRERMTDYYVYTELDSLEYAIQKFQFGLIRPPVVTRALGHFERECLRDDAFRERVAGLVVSGGYFDATKDVVARIIDRARSAANVQRARPPG